VLLIVLSPQSGVLECPEMTFYGKWHYVNELKPTGLRTLTSNAVHGRLQGESHSKNDNAISFLEWL